MTNVSATKDISATIQQKNIEKAARSNNPIEAVVSALHFTASNGNHEYTIYSRTKANLETKILKWAFKLAERNVGPFYKELAMGWQPKKKQTDLNKNWARYLVAKDKNGTAAAYAMFRFDMDYGQSVLYCYEMQIEPSSQRQGLGKFMMNVLELCARHWEMEKVILTVLKNNSNAMSFFRAIGYTVDESNPDILENAEYEILSKPINRT